MQAATKKEARKSLLLWFARPALFFAWTRLSRQTRQHLQFPWRERSSFRLWGTPSLELDDVIVWSRHRMA